MKPRARYHTDYDVWSVWSAIASGYGRSLAAAYEGWRRAESHHQLQVMRPRAAYVPHIARWLDC